MVNKLMYIPNEDTQNYPLCRLQLGVETLDTNKSNLIKSPQGKVDNQRIGKRYYNTLGTSVKNSQVAPSSLPVAIAVQNHSTLIDVHFLYLQFFTGFRDE